MDSTEMMEQQQQQEPEQEEEAQPQQEEQQQVEEEQPTAPVQPMEEAPVQEAVQQEEQQQLQLAIATSFSVVQDEHQDAGEFVIKQEPQEPLPDEPEEELEEQEEHHGLFGDEPMDQELDPAQIYTEVISDSILQRAVSPPTYVSTLPARCVCSLRGTRWCLLNAVHNLFYGRAVWGMFSYMRVYLCCICLFLLLVCVAKMFVLLLVNNSITAANSLFFFHDLLFILKIQKMKYILGKNRDGKMKFEIFVTLVL